MILCNKDCIPCCDFCIYVIHEMLEVDGQMVKCEPIGCKLHTDEKHQNIAVNCCYCEDYHCFRAT